jgi:hypothetical protein
MQNFRLLGVWVLGAALACVPGVSGQDSSGSQPGMGVGGSSPGSPGMEDSERNYQNLARNSQKKGARSVQYAGSLLDLGMHYNRANEFKKAESALLQSLAIIDSGALKPTSGYQERPPRVEQHGNGVVSATNMNTPTPYEDMMENLLPALISSESGCGHLTRAEEHCKRLIAICNSNAGRRLPGLMSAYWQYADVLRKMHRTKEAEQFQRKGDQINKSIIPL